MKRQQKKWFSSIIIVLLMLNLFPISRVHAAGNSIELSPGESVKVVGPGNVNVSDWFDFALYDATGKSIAYGEESYNSFNLKSNSYIIIQNKSEEPIQVDTDVTATKVDEPALKRIAFNQGDSWEYKGGENFAIEGSHDYVIYNDDGTAKDYGNEKAWQEISDIGSKQRMIITSNEDQVVYGPYELFKDPIVSSQPALKHVPFTQGASWEYRGGGDFTIENSHDYVIYNSDGTSKEYENGQSWQRITDVGSKQKMIITSNEDQDVYGPYELFKDPIVSSQPALKHVPFNQGDSWEYQGGGDFTIESSHDYALYNADGTSPEYDSRVNWQRLIDIGSKQKMILTSEEDQDVYGPYELFKDPIVSSQPALKRVTFNEGESWVYYGDSNFRIQGKVDYAYYKENGLSSDYGTSIWFDYFSNLDSNKKVVLTSKEDQEVYGPYEIFKTPDMSTVPALTYKKLNAGESVSFPRGATFYVPGKYSYTWTHEDGTTDNETGVNDSFFIKDGALNLQNNSFEDYVLYGPSELFTGLQDKTEPQKLEVNPVDDQSWVVTGVTEMEAAVTVKDGTNVLGTAQADATGKFAVSIMVQKAGTVLSVTAQDPFGNISKPVEVPVSDVTAPIEPEVNKVTNQSQEITGTSEPNMTVTIQAGDQVLATGTADSQGNFAITIDQQPVGTKLSVIAIDAADNKSTATEVTVVDGIAPVFSGVNEVTLTTGNSFDELNGVTATDNVDGDVTDFIYVTGYVDTEVPGTYTLTYTVIDADGNTAMVERKVTVENPADTEAPIFSGVDDVTIQVGDSFDVTAGVTATDKVDGDLTEKIEVTGDVDTEKTGTYTLTYKVTDTAGNTVTVERTVTVEDSQAPVFDGVSDVTISVGTSFDAKAGVKAIDNVDGDLTSKIVVTGSVDTKKPAIYTLTYTVTDTAGNSVTVFRRVTVKDNQAPVFSGVKDVTVEAGAKFDAKAGVKATDNVDGDLTSKVVVTGTVNTNKLGTYTLTYKVTDAAKNTATMTRKVTVIDSQAPIFSGVSDVTIALGAKFDAKAGVKATDSVDGDLTSKIVVTGTVNTKKQGTYTLTYKVTDTAKNTTTVKRKVTVKDLQAPVFSGIIDKTIAQGTKFDPKAGVKATDNVDGDLTSKIVVTGTVNTKVLGTYTLTYKVTDKAGNTTTVTRKITVKDLQAPEAPKVNKVHSKDKVVTGKAEAGAKVVVKAGKKTYFGYAKPDGTYSVKIDPQKAGTSITVTAVDKAGNTSKPSNTTVVK